MAHTAIVVQLKVKQIGKTFLIGKCKTRAICAKSPLFSNIDKIKYKRKTCGINSIKTLKISHKDGTS